MMYTQMNLILPQFDIYSEFLVDVFTLWCFKNIQKGGINMTSNQIAYWEAMEKNRHNVAAENIDVVRNVETERHNRETERENILGLNEAARSNQANEAIRAHSNQISAANTMVNYTLGLGNLRAEQRRNTETKRHNVVAESEAQRHNKMQEGLGFAGAVSGIIGASIKAAAVAMA